MTQHDVCVVGGGVTGLAAAVGLEQAGRSVVVVEARSAPAWNADQHDPRVYAVSPAAAAWLDALGVWAAVPRRHAFTAMQVWDAHADLGWQAANMGLPALGHIVEDAALIQALLGRLSGSIRCPETVEAVELQAEQVCVQTDQGRLQARLLVAADGPQSPMRHRLGIATAARAYPAQAVVAHVRCEQPHRDTAWQRFADTGPIGLLPLSDGRVSVVWSLDAPHDARVLDLDDSGFCAALTQALDGRLGAVTETGPRRRFPLGRQHADHYVQGRAVLLGDAAHVIHPLAGQGLNLGLADAQALVTALAEQTDPGKPAPLARYARQRRADNARMIAVTDGLYRLFATRHPAVGGLRALGMNALDLLPGAKQRLAEQALGLRAGFPQAAG